MSPAEAAKFRRSLITTMDGVSQQLNDFVKPHRGEMGLVSDEIRNTPKYKALNEAYHIAKGNLATFLKAHQGKEYAKAFKAETIEHFKQKRGK